MAHAMRVAAAHHGPSILEDLHISNVRHRTYFLGLARPKIDDIKYRIGRHAAERQVVSGGKTDDSTYPTFGFRDQQILLILDTVRGIYEK